MPRVPTAYLDARRDSIIEAARRAFFRHGTRATTMAEIAGEAGITPGAIYRYFSNKDVLVDACFGKNAAVVEKEWAAVPATGDHLADLARLAAEGFAEIGMPECRIDTIIHLEHLLDLVRADDAAELTEFHVHHGVLQHAIAARLAAARDAGQLPPGTNPESLAQVLLAFYWGTRIARLVDAGIDPPKLLAEVMALLSRPRPAARTVERVEPDHPAAP